MSVPQPPSATSPSHDTSDDEADALRRAELAQQAVDARRRHARGPASDDPSRRAEPAASRDDLTPANLTSDDAASIIRELRKQLAEYDTLLRVIPIGISIAKDPECRIIVSNRHHASLLGHGPTDNTSIDPSAPDPASFRIFRDGAELQVDELPMHRAIHEKREIVNVECDVITDRGERLTLIGHSAPLFDDEGNVTGAVGAFDNITERKLAEEKIAESERRHRELAAENARLYEEAQAALRLRDNFVATVSHELRSPLSSILLSTGMLKRAPYTQETLERALETIERSARRQTRLIDDLLEMSRIAKAELRIDCREIDLASVVSDAFQTLSDAAAARGVTLACDLPSSPIHVFADPDRLHQVVWNLVSNAIKFAPRGHVRVAVFREADEAIVRVTDDGRGIAADFLPHVFEQFRQAPDDQAVRAQGLGLGLAIVRHIVGLHGGRVEAQSDGPGQGATFIVALPVEQLASIGPPSAGAT
jgi:signal transduction histidine kinase